MPRIHLFLLWMSLALISFTGPASAQAPLRLVVDADQGETTISRHIYGHFAEHLGRGIYDGIWSKAGGGDWVLRDDVIEALRAIKIPNLRWPGGCFADYYHWMDGIGPRADRPTIVNNLWGGVTEDNSFGTHEFMALIDRLGADPVVVGNVGSGTVQEMSQWWEYMNHPGVSPMADLRRENGRDTPWNVRFWGVGNESWGCGGNMRPEFYADQYKRYATYLHRYGDVRPFRIATGAGSDDYAWTEVMMRDAGEMIDGLDIHNYTLNGTWAKKGPAVGFSEAEWFELMQRALQQDDLVSRHATIMDRYDPEKRVWLIMGEWGTWHEREPGSTPGFLYQQNTLRDALVAAISLNIFNSHADRVKMANIAQTVNVLQAMILTRGEQLILTPTYHVFALYTAHHDATLLPIHLDAGAYTYEDQSLPALSASASKQTDGSILITIANIDPHQARDVAIDVRGLDVRSVSGRILNGAAMDAHNTFERPNEVAPASFDGARLAGGTVALQVPAHALVALTLR
ncbi:MAG: alpha-L-arabinofuranosidase C-terminal domain-containing protein [Rhodothermales bacterium]